MQRIKHILLAYFALGLYSGCTIEVRSEFFSLSFPQVSQSVQDAFPFRAICCSSRQDENMFTLRAETRAYSCVMRRREGHSGKTKHTYVYGGLSGFTV